MAGRQSSHELINVQHDMCWCLDRKLVLFVLVLCGKDEDLNGKLSSRYAKTSCWYVHYVANCHSNISKEWK